MDNQLFEKALYEARESAKGMDNVFVEDSAFVLFANHLTHNGIKGDKIVYGYLSQHDEEEPVIEISYEMELENGDFYDGYCNSINLSEILEAYGMNNYSEFRNHMIEMYSNNANAWKLIKLDLDKHGISYLDDESEGGSLGNGFFMSNI